MRQATRNHLSFRHNPRDPGHAALLENPALLNSLRFQCADELLPAGKTDKIIIRTRNRRVAVVDNNV